MMSSYESDPSHCTLYCDILRSEGDLLVGDRLPPNIARRMLYATYVSAVHGVLEWDKIVVVPSYIKDLTRELVSSFPHLHSEQMVINH